MYKALSPPSFMAGPIEVVPSSHPLQVPIEALTNALPVVVDAGFPEAPLEAPSNGKPLAVLTLVPLRGQVSAPVTSCCLMKATNHIRSNLSATAPEWPRPSVEPSFGVIPSAVLSGPSPLVVYDWPSVAPIIAPSAAPLDSTPKPNVSPSDVPSGSMSIDSIPDLSANPSLKSLGPSPRCVRLALCGTHHWPQRIIIGLRLQAECQSQWLAFGIQVYSLASGSVYQPQFELVGPQFPPPMPTSLMHLAPESFQGRRWCRFPVTPLLCMVSCPHVKKAPQVVGPLWNLPLVPAPRL
jgi:hypothetical protein